MCDREVESAVVSNHPSPQCAGAFRAVTWAQMILFWFYFHLRDRRSEPYTDNRVPRHRQQRQSIFLQFSSCFLVATLVVLKIEHGNFIQTKLKILTALDLCVTVMCLNSDISKHSMIEVVSK